MSFLISGDCNLWYSVSVSRPVSSALFAKAGGGVSVCHGRRRVFFEGGRHSCFCALRSVPQVFEHQEHCPRSAVLLVSEHEKDCPSGVRRPEGLPLWSSKTSGGILLASEDQKDRPFGHRGLEGQPSGLRTTGRWSVWYLGSLMWSFGVARGR